MDKLKKILLAAVLVMLAGGCGWYFGVKKPHDDAVAHFTSAAAAVQAKNDELNTAVSGLQAVIDSGDEPYDTSTLTAANAAVQSAKDAERTIPAMPDETKEIINTINQLNQPLDYSSQLSSISDAKSVLETSITQMKQITNPSEEFVMERLSSIPEITDMAAVTEDNDPNQLLHKQGGYNAEIFFTDTFVNQSSVYGTDVISRGTQGGGAVEVYETAEGAQARDTYLALFDGMGAFNPGSHHVYGTVVIRTSSKLTATQQQTLEQEVADALLEVK